MASIGDTDIRSGNQSVDMRPFIFMVTFWGPTYSQYFVDRCLPSLLAPGNFPQLRAQDGHRLLIATTADDWEAIERLPIMQEIRRYVTPVHLEIEPPAATMPGSESAILQQNRCHKVLLEAAYPHRSYGCMLWPDIIFSDGLCAALRRWAAEGQELVLFASLRHVQESVLDELSERDFLPRDARPSLTCQPLTIPPRALADISTRHLHPEVLVYEFEDPKLPILPVHIFARIPGGRGIALHTFHGQQILMDFGAVETHDTDCLKDGLFEDIYLDRNFAGFSKIHVVCDSDEFGILSLTPMHVGSFYNRRLFGQARLGRTLAVLCRLRAAMTFHTRRHRDLIRRDLFRVPILWHSGEIDGSWTEKQARLDRLIEQATSDFYPHSTESPSFSLKLWRVTFDIFYRVYLWRRHLRIIGEAALGERKAWSIIGRSIKRSFTGSRPSVSAES